MGEIATDGACLRLSGEMQGSDLLGVTSSLWKLMERDGHGKATLDMSEVTRAYPDLMVPVICEVKRYRSQGKVFDFELPRDPTARRFFDGSNYTYLLTDEGEPHLSAHGPHLPAIPFGDADAQFEVVNLLVDWMLSVTVLEGRQDLQAFEWSVAEVTDNVITHAETDAGGLAQATYHPKDNSVQFVICDSGVGIPESFRAQAEFAELADPEVLEIAVRESVTSKRETNQGNGLYGTYELARVSKGRFTLRSGHAVLYLDGKHQLVVRESRIPFHGTLVICSLSLGNERLIEQALRIKGQPHTISYDYLDATEDDESGHVILAMAKQDTGFSSREKARPLRMRVANYLRTTDTLVVLDFAEVGVVSSSFADEFVARLMREFGPMVFMSRVRIRNANSTVASLLDRAMMLRMSTPD